MPLDFTSQEIVPDHLNFPVVFEQTKYEKSKYVINGDTGEYLGIVGTGFKCASHGDFFTRAHNTVSEVLGESYCDSMNINYRSARNNAWALMDMTMPSVLRRIETDKHTTTIAPRLIALHGIDGSCSNMAFFGAIDFFCTNGMVRGEHDKVKRKNTSGFDLDRFGEQVQKSNNDFKDYHQQIQRWANKSLFVGDVKAMLESLDKGKAEGLFQLYNQEAGVRGNNAFALYSAFTNYASYADERNGFKLRNTGKDTAAKNMWEREERVTRWIESKQFKELLAA